MKILSKGEREAAHRLLSAQRCPLCKAEVINNVTSGVYTCTSESCGETFAYIYNKPKLNNRITSESIPVFD